MRVIAGTLGGRRLRPVPGRGTRPTADRVREALFSRIESRYRLVGTTVLDLFAGTGALGIEALSRGATQLVSVESDRGAVAVLRANLESLGLTERAVVIARDVGKTLDQLSESGRTFNGVFLDPPYADRAAGAVLQALATGGLLRAGAWISVETASVDELPGQFEALNRAASSVYGDTRLTLYERG